MHCEVEPQLGVTEALDTYTQIMFDFLVNIFTPHKKDVVLDIWHENSQRCVAALSLCEITLHIFVGNYYLKPEANILQIPKRHDFFKTSELFYIELALWNWITDSLVFSAQRYDVISWLFLRYLFALSLSCAVFCHVLLCCAVQWQEEPTHDLLCLFFFCQRVGGQFLLNAASFKSI